MVYSQETQTRKNIKSNEVKEMIGSVLFLVELFAVVYLLLCL